MAAVWSLVVDLAHEMRLLATGEPREAAPARGEGLPEPCRSRRVGEATETSFIVLFRSRGARFGAIHAPALFTDCDIGGASLSAYARPAPWSARHAAASGGVRVSSALVGSSQRSAARRLV